MNPYVKTEGKCNESVNNEFKIMRQSNSSQADNETNLPYSCWFNCSFSSLF